jgi:hypothetical protein
MSLTALELVFIFWSTPRNPNHFGSIIALRCWRLQSKCHDWKVVAIRTVIAWDWTRNSLSQLCSWPLRDAIVLLLSAKARNILRTARHFSQLNRDVDLHIDFPTSTSLEKL